MSIWSTLPPPSCRISPSSWCTAAAEGQGLLEKLKSAGVEVIECAAVKPWELPQFVSGEAKRAGSSIDAAAASALVDAVGHDLRALAAAVAQLLSDGEGGPITVDQVRRYFGGRSEVTSFAVADAALAGRTGVAMEQLRWALATGVAPVLITSAWRPASAVLAS